MPVGRPTKYDPSMCEIAEKNLAEGFTIRAVSGILNVHHQTVYNWMEEHEEFFDSIKRGTDKGLLYLERKLKEKLENKHATADTTILIFALKTRYHEVYGDKQKLDQNHKVEVQLNYDIDKLNPNAR